MTKIVTAPIIAIKMQWMKEKCTEKHRERENKEGYPSSRSRCF